MDTVHEGQGQGSGRADIWHQAVELQWGKAKLLSQMIGVWRHQILPCPKDSGVGLSHGKL